MTVSSFISLVMVTKVGLCTGEEHACALDIMEEEDKPDIDDSGPALVLTAFSDNETNDAKDDQDW